MPATRAPRNLQVLSLRRRGFETTRSPAPGSLSLSGQRATLIGTTGSDPYAVPTPSANDRYFDPTLGTNGDGSFASPWNTITRTRLATLAPGQMLWLVNGTGSGTWNFDRGGATEHMTGLQAGTASQPIGIAPYPGHTPLIWNFPESGIAFAMRNWKIWNPNIVGPRNGIRMGWNSWHGSFSGLPSVPDTVCSDVTIIDPTGTRGLTTADPTWDNSGLITAANEPGVPTSAQRISVIRGHLDMPQITGTVRNQALVWTDNIRSFHLIGTLFTGLSAQPFYLKHQDQADPNATDILIQNCIFFGSLRMTVKASGARFINNAFWARVINQEEIIGGTEPPTGNRFLHNTFYNTDVGGAFADVRSVDCYGRDNVFAGAEIDTGGHGQVRGSLRVRRYATQTGVTGDDWDYSAVASGIRYNQDGSNMTLAQYQAATGQETNAEQGIVTFAGTPSSDPATWALAASSIGRNNASDGTDRGVDAAKLLTVN